MSTRMRMGRRAFARKLASLVAALGAFCLPGTSNAQQPASPRRIGVLLMAFSPESKEALEFRHALRDAGYAEGRDISIEWRSANGNYDRLPELAADLVQRKLDVIVVDSTAGAQAVKRATSTIPIVMAIVADPIGSGLVANLAHPGGNVTGLSTMMTELSAKRLQLLKEVLPQATRVAVLSNPRVPWYPKAVEHLKEVAPSLAIKLSFVSVRTPEEIGPAFSAVSRARAQALYVLADALLIIHRGTLIRLASKAGLPTIFNERRFPDEGGLMSYGPNWPDAWRRSARYVDKILKGAKPSDLPIEQPTRFELVINLKTA
ncbi:MAG: ABC transporter substrate-binding protein, partial [bacterium]